MFEFLSKRLITQELSETDDEYYSDQEGEEDFLRHLLYSNDHVKWYLTTARDLVPNVKLWSAQRELVPTHVETLAENLKQREHLIGTFKAIRDRQGSVRLIDGQHRLEALRVVMGNDSKFNADIMLEVYETDTLESKHAIQLFKEANNCLNVKLSDLPDPTSTSAVNKLSTMFPSALTDTKPGQRCNRPRIDKRQLCTRLKELLEITPMNEQDLLSRILEINKAYGLRARKTFSKVTPSMHDKCKRSGFYLGLDRRMEWVAFILSQESP